MAEAEAETETGRTTMVRLSSSDVIRVGGRGEVEEGVCICPGVVGGCGAYNLAG